MLFKRENKKAPCKLGGLVLFTHSWEACFVNYSALEREWIDSPVNLASGTRWQRVHYAGKKKFITLL